MRARLGRHASAALLRAKRIPRTLARERDRRANRLELIESPAQKNLAQIGGIHLTHPDRVLFEDQGITKQQLAEYYVGVGERILPHIANRPLSIMRCPSGLRQECFYQKHLSRGMPAAIKPVQIRDSKGWGDYLSVSDLSGLVALVQFGVLEIHPWSALVDDIEHTDRLIFDLDPGPGVAWARLIEAALEIKHRLERIKLTSYVKTTGGKGLHVVVPLRPAIAWDLAKDFAHGLALAMAAASPALYLVRSTKSARQNRIFIDYLRNQRGATAVAPFSTRAWPGAPVSVPLDWSELSVKLRPERFGIDNAVQRPADVWADFFEERQTIRRSDLDRLIKLA